MYACGNTPCDGEAKLKCTVCMVRYCSKECQHVAWPRHKISCNPMTRVNRIVARHVPSAGLRANALRCKTRDLAASLKELYAEADVYRHHRMFEAATALTEEGLSRADTPRERAAFFNLQGHILRAQNDLPGALMRFQEEMKCLDLTPGDAAFPACLSEIAEICFMCGEKDRGAFRPLTACTAVLTPAGLADKLWNVLMAHLITDKAVDPIFVITAKLKMAACYVDAGRVLPGRELMASALRSLDAMPTPSVHHRVTTLLGLAKTYLITGQQDEARRHVQMAYDEALAKLGEGDSLTQKCKALL